LRSIKLQPKGPTRGEPPSRRVLAIVGDSQVGLWVVRSLGRRGLAAPAVCHSERGLSAHSRYGCGAWQIESRPGDAGFADEVEGLVRQTGAGSIMAIAESYHRALIACRDRFEPDVHVFSPPAEAYAKATDKYAMHRLCAELGVPVARGTTLERLMADPEGSALRFPLVLRTRNQNVDEGRAPCKAAYAEDAAQLRELHEAIRPSAANVLVQEYHPGAEDHVQVLMHRGEPVMVGEYIGEHHMPLAGGVTVQRITCRHEDVIRDAVKLLKAVGWEGVGGVQFHYDTATGKYIFLEINPRFIGGLPTVIMAGFDAPFLLWQSHFEPEKMRKTPYRLGLRTRILGGDANWMLAMIRGDPLPPGQKRLSKIGAVARFLWNCGPWTRDDTFWWRDPKPFWVDLRSMAPKLRERSVDIIGNPDSGDATEGQDNDHSHHGR
jgi:predicted ATP-grasp superfamily ATP-dependent carboligase